MVLARLVRMERMARMRWASPERTETRMVAERLLAERGLPVAMALRVKLVAKAARGSVEHLE